MQVTNHGATLLSSGSTMEMPGTLVFIVFLANACPKMYILLAFERLRHEFSSLSYTQNMRGVKYPEQVSMLIFFLDPTVVKKSHFLPPKQASASAAQIPYGLWDIIRLIQSGL